MVRHCRNRPALSEFDLLAFHSCCGLIAPTTKRPIKLKVPMDFYALLPVAACSSLYSSVRSLPTPRAITRRHEQNCQGTFVSNIRLTYRFLFQLAFAGLACAPALAEAGQIYSPEQITGLSVADLKIGMSAVDAEHIVSGAAYEGSLAATFEEKTAAQWIKFDRALFLFRFIDAAGTTRLWRIRFGQKFDVPQSIDVLKQKVIEKYGEPSEIDGTNGDLVYHTPFKLDHGIAKACYASGSPTCWDTAMLGTKYRQPTEMEAAYVTEIESPEMRVSITPTTMYVDLRSFGLASESERRRNLSTAAAIEKKRVENAKHLDLGF